MFLPLQKLAEKNLNCKSSFWVSELLEKNKTCLFCFFFGWDFVTAITRELQLRGVAATAPIATTATPCSCS
jgi:hypothetical protein